MYSITKMCNSKKDVEAVYLFLSDLCSEYSNFRQWYHDTVVPGLANGERLIYAVTDNEAIVAVLILKNADEKKICTLRVAENHRHQGIASMLLALAFRELQIPKQPISKSWSPNLCPHCDADLGGDCNDGYYQNPHYERCPVCGQKLKYI